MLSNKTSGEDELSSFSHVQLFAAPWTVACQAPLSLGFSRQEYWSGLPCPSPGDLPDSETKPTPLVSPALAVKFLLDSATCSMMMEIVYFCPISYGNHYSHVPSEPFKCGWCNWATNFAFLNWSTTDLQYCTCFRCIALWFSLGGFLLKIFLHSSLLQDIGYNFSCYTINL